MAGRKPLPTTVKSIKGTPKGVNSLGSQGTAPPVCTDFYVCKIKRIFLISCPVVADGGDMNASARN